RTTSCVAHPPATLTLFPYTTLFRSKAAGDIDAEDSEVDEATLADPAAGEAADAKDGAADASDDSDDSDEKSTGKDEELPTGALRSEEHTSELQSRENLVCRLLLEKK